MTDRRDLFAAAALAGQFAKRGYASGSDMVAIWRAVDELLGADPTLQHGVDPDAPCHVCIQNGAVVEIVDGPDEDGNVRLQTLQGQKWPSGDRAQWWFDHDGNYSGGCLDWTVRPGTQAELDAARHPSVQLFQEEGVMGDEALADCPECGGYGWFEAQQCCQRSEWECGAAGCTGPVSVQEACQYCDGTGSVSAHA